MFTHGAVLGLILSLPRWWINMMSPRWQQEYKRRMGSILKSAVPTDPLFSVDELRISMEEIAG